MVQPTQPGAAAASRKLAAQVAELGAEKLADYASARGHDLSSLQIAAKEGRLRTVFRGPRQMWLTPLDGKELDAELETLRCDWSDCDRLALLSKTGLCRRCAAKVARNGRVTSTEFARKHGVFWADLHARLEADEIASERVDRGGRPVCRLLDEEQAIAEIEERFPCRREGCAGWGLGKSRHCQKHAAGAAAIDRAGHLVEMRCAVCLRTRKDFPSQQRNGDLCHQCNLKSEEFARKRKEAVAETQEARRATVASARADGLMPVREAADEVLLYLSPETTGYQLSAEGKLHREERLTGRFKQVFTTEESAINFRRYLAQSEPEDGRRKAALDPSVQVRRIEGLRGRALTSSERSEIEARIRARAEAIRNHRKGRKKGAGPSAQHSEWVELHDELTDVYEREVAAGDLSTVPPHRAISAEVAQELLADEFGRESGKATERVDRAVKRARERLTQAA